MLSIYASARLTQAKPSSSCVVCFQSRLASLLSIFFSSENLILYSSLLQRPEARPILTALLVSPTSDPSFSPIIPSIKT